MKFAKKKAFLFRATWLERYKMFACNGWTTHKEEYRLVYATTTVDAEHKLKLKLSEELAEGNKVANSLEITNLTIE